MHNNHLESLIKFRFSASSLPEMWISRFGMEMNLCIFTEHAKWISDYAFKPLQWLMNSMCVRESKSKITIIYKAVVSFKNEWTWVVIGIISGKKWTHQRNSLKRIYEVWPLGRMCITHISRYENYPNVKLTRDDSKTEFHLPIIHIIRYNRESKGSHMPSYPHPEIAAICYFISGFFD